MRTLIDLSRLEWVTPPSLASEPATPSLRQAAAEWREAWAASLTQSPEELALRAALTAGIFIAALVVIWLLHRGRTALMAHFTRAPSAGDAVTTSRGRKIGRVTLAFASLIILFFALELTLRVWGTSATAFAETATGEFVSSLARAAMIIVLAVAAIELTSFFNALLTARLVGRTGNRRRAAQLSTVTPLIQGIFNTLIVLIAVSMILAEAGVQVAPLLAGAGIAGIAIGFGAQTLVKDLFTGAFLIAEDIVARGDVVEINGFSGTVEAMTLRTIRLRDFDGTLHIFPYGEAQVIHNKTSTFSYFAFELQISYMADIGRAIEVVEGVGQSLETEPRLRNCILSPIQIVGVDKLTDNGVMLKGRIKTQPGDQWRVGRLFHHRVKEALDAAGVLISHRHLPVPPFDAIKDEVASGPYAPPPADSGA